MQRIGPAADRGALRVDPHPKQSRPVTAKSRGQPDKARDLDRGLFPEQTNQGYRHFQHSRQQDIGSQRQIQNRVGQSQCLAAPCRDDKTRERRCHQEPTR